MHDRLKTCLIARSIADIPHSAKAMRGIDAETAEAEALSCERRERGKGGEANRNKGLRAKLTARLNRPDRSARGSSPSAKRQLP